MISKTILINTGIVISYAIKRGRPTGNMMESQLKLRQKYDQKFPMERTKAIVQNVLASDERNKSKRAGLIKSQSGIRVGKLTITVRSFEIEKL